MTKCTEVALRSSIAPSIALMPPSSGSGRPLSIVGRCAPTAYSMAATAALIDVLERFLAVICPALLQCLSGPALLKLAGTCRVAHGCMRRETKSIQAAWREIMTAVRYLSMAPLRFPGFESQDILQLHKVSLIENSAWRDVANACLTPWPPARAPEAFRYLNKQLTGRATFEQALAVLTTGEARFFFPTSGPDFNKPAENPWLCGSPTLILTMRYKSIPVTISLRYAGSLSQGPLTS